MDTFLAIASRREDRSFDERPIPADVQRRILEAGRVAGSAANKQPWRFLVIEKRVDELAEIVYVSQNILSAKLIVAVVAAWKGPDPFDAGRAAQNMMLAAWNEGVGSCPNGISDHDRGRELLGAEPHEGMIVLSFGYPARRRDPESRTPEEWIARAKRKPFDEVVKRL
jgi:nitroreductase